MRAALEPLAQELRIWRTEGLTLPVWWRDDDAVAATPALERLIGLAQRFSAPLHLAVVPALAQGVLAGRVSEAPEVFALTHGWRHANHAPRGAKKAEFGAHRPAAERSAEAARGRETIANLFGSRALPVFVPPWNRVDETLLPLLPEAGFAAVSAFAPRRARLAAPGLIAVNTHCDPIDWHGGRGLVDPQIVIAQAAGELRGRREGRIDAGEPYGLLTHHLVHDEAVWGFVEALLALLAGSGAARWEGPLGRERLQARAGDAGRAS